MTNTELIQKIKAEIERRITDNTFGAKLELIDILAWLSTLESEKPINPEAAMKELDEKIALVKERGTWEGVDVDSYMDEVRGRVSDDLEEAADNHIRKVADAAGHPGWDWTTQDIADAFIAGAKWQKEQDEEEQADLFTIVALDAAQRAKEQMMKDAVEGEYGYFSSASKTILPSGKLNLKEGDKVRIIIVKEDEK